MMDSEGASQEIVGPLCGLVKQQKVDLMEIGCLDSELLHVQQMISRVKATTLRARGCAACSKLDLRLQSLIKRVQLA